MPTASSLEGSEPRALAREGGADLGVTALYTAATWRFGGLSGAELFATPIADRVFAWTNAVMWIAGRFRRGLPSLPYSLLQRHLTIDALVRASGTCSIVELAAGLSRRGVGFTADPTCTCTELDLPAMIAYKRELLERSPAGREVLARANLRLVEGDALATPLSSLVAGEAPLLIAEGLMMYLDTGDRRRLLHEVARLVQAREGAAFVFDLTPGSEQPRPGLIGRALGWLMRRFTRGRGFVADPTTRADLVAEVEAAGFGFARALEPGEVLDRATMPGAGRRTQVVLFLCAAETPRWLS